jgi:NADPH2 dehydrogenase
MAPLTRLRSDEDHVPLPIAVEYYAQRASVPGTLIITEANFVSFEASGRDANAPGIYTEDQIRQWSTICDAVHQRGSFIFLQIWHVGRAARLHALQAKGLDMVSSSAIPISDDHPTPRAMTEGEIQRCIKDFAQAAQNAMRAGFDGVEIHGANGYLIDQFIQDTCNHRTDAWGGSVENRSRFCLRIAEAVVDAVGPERTGIRLSPFNQIQGMGMEDPVPQFTHLISRLQPLKLAYLHMVEPRMLGNDEVSVAPTKTLAFAFQAWNKVSPVLLAGGYTFERAAKAVDLEYQDQEVAIAFGRWFISNPDLPFRFRNGVSLNPYDRETFYKAKSADGYIDYPFSDGSVSSTFSLSSAPHALTRS